MANCSDCAAARAILVVVLVTVAVVAVWGGRAAEEVGNGCARRCLRSSAPRRCEGRMARPQRGYPAWSRLVSA